MDINETLLERGKTHGSFTENAHAAQALKRVIAEHTTERLTDVQLEALDNICQKMARIITGDANHQDSWHDIAGYATLAEMLCNDA